MGLGQEKFKFWMSRAKSAPVQQRQYTLHRYNTLAEFSEQNVLWPITAKKLRKFGLPYTIYPVDWSSEYSVSKYRHSNTFFECVQG